MLERRRFKAGEVIIRENDLGETAFIIEKGRVEITKQMGGKQVHLATLGVGETIGEMSMIDDQPRSATATAVELTEVREIHHDGFYEALQTDPEVTLLVLKALFERLREANVTILQLRAEGATAGGAEAAARAGGEASPVVLLEGLTREAEAALPASPFRIDKLPVRIGRKSHNPLVYNDLTLEDEMPWQISRHHVAIVTESGRVGVIDRGSTLGCTVDGLRLGGRGGSPGPIFFEGPEGTLRLGSEKSPYEFRVSIQAAEG
jgi:CRP-like cAMP-binding protein